MEKKQRGRPRTKVYKHNGYFISRQRAWQISQVQQGLCMYCPNEQGTHPGYCDPHYDKMLNRRRALTAKRKEAALQKA